jgi:hypothetical protein
MNRTIKQRRSLYAEAPPEVKALLRRTADRDLAVAAAAMRELAVALELPLRKGLLYGNVIGDIFSPYNLEPDAAPEFPIDPVAPGVAQQHVAYALPQTGAMPSRTFEGDYIMVPTFDVGNAIEWPLKLAQRSRWDIVGRGLELFEAGFVKKDNDDGWHVLLASALDRNIIVFDGNAGQGRFTLRLISLMDQAMRRNAGGNTATPSRGRLTDIYMSIECLEDMRNWTLAEVTDSIRNQIMTSDEGYISRIFQTNLHEMIELGVNQEYQNYYQDPTYGLGGVLAEGDVELVVGFDLQRDDAFVNPIREPLSVFEDMTLHKARKAGVYGWKEHGFAAVDNRRIILGSI